MKRAFFLATAALVAMLLLTPMAMGQGTTVFFAGGGGDGSPSASVNVFPPLTPETGGSAILLPAAALLVGSGILTYAILRRR